MKDYYRRHTDRSYVVRNYARALFLNKKYQESIPVFEKAAALDRTYQTKASYYIGMAKFFSGNYDDGMKDLVKVRDMAPNLPRERMSISSWPRWRKISGKFPLWKNRRR